MIESRVKKKYKVCSAVCAVVVVVPDVVVVKTVRGITQQNNRTGPL